MRDIFVTMAVFGSIPLIFMQPYVGILVWSWLGYMNPHRLAWGFSTNFPFAMIVAVVTIAALLFSKEPKRIPWTSESKLLVIFILWMLVTTFFSLYPDLAWTQFWKVIKIQVAIFLTLILINSREKIHALAWMIAVSLGFYGIKGGIFTITSGGGQHVQGPDGTFIGGNNEIGLALIMTIPLMRYLQLNTQRAWLRYGLIGAMAFTTLAVFGTQSRGALLGIAAMGLFLLFKSRQKIVLITLLAISIPVALSFMPQSWHERMGTIKTYDEDESALGRIDSWKFAFQQAVDRPLTGGGFEVFSGRTDAHSIYFEILGEHGFVGLILFLSLGIMAWRTGTWVVKSCKDQLELKWLSDLASMLQVCLIGYAVGGAFLGLAYFDLYYHLVAMLAICKLLYLKAQAGEVDVVPQGKGAPWFQKRDNTKKIAMK